MKTRSCRGYFLVSIAVIAALAKTGYCQEDYTQWAHSQNIVINTSATGYNITQDVANFPYVVRLSGSSFTFSQAKAGGADIRFGKSSGTVVLPYQIELWDTLAGVAVIWVKVDLIQANNATQSITMYWGKSDAVDRSSGPAVFETANGFAGVWHLGDTPAGAGTIKDATTNASHGTPQGDMTAGNLVTGSVGRALSFDGGDDFVDCGTRNIGLSGDPAYTISAWVKPFEIKHDGSVVSYGNAGGSRVISMVESGTVFYVVHYGMDYMLTTSWTMNQWQFVTIKYSPATSAESLYVDGVYKERWTLANNLALVAPDRLMIGGSSWNGTTFGRGTIDEVTISRGLRSPAWIRLSCLNQKSVVSAAPVIRYPQDHVVLPVNTILDPLVPAITGDFDSITVTPRALPDYILFDKSTGTFSGWTQIDTIRNMPVIVRIYNVRGFTADTVYFTLGTPTAAMQHGTAAAAPVKLLGVRPKILFSVPSPGRVRSVRFAIGDLKGSSLWQRKIDGAALKCGLNSIPMDQDSRTARPAQGVYFLEMDVEWTDPGAAELRQTKMVFIP